MITSDYWSSYHKVLFTSFMSMTYYGAVVVSCLITILLVLNTTLLLFKNKSDNNFIS